MLAQHDMLPPFSAVRMRALSLPLYSVMFLSDALFPALPLSVLMLRLVTDIEVFVDFASEADWTHHCFLDLSFFADSLRAILSSIRLQPNCAVFFLLALYISRISPMSLSAVDVSSMRIFCIKTPATYSKLRGIFMQLYAVAWHVCVVQGTWCTHARSYLWRLIGDFQMLRAHHFFRKNWRTPLKHTCNVTLAVVDSIKERCSQWICRVLWSGFRGGEILGLGLGSVSFLSRPIHCKHLSLIES